MKNNIINSEYFRFNADMVDVEYKPEESRVILKNMGDSLKKLMEEQGIMENLPEQVRQLLTGWGESEEDIGRPRKGLLRGGNLTLEESISGTNLTRTIYQGKNCKVIEVASLPSDSFDAITEVMIPVDGNLSNMTW